MPRRQITGADQRMAGAAPDSRSMLVTRSIEHDHTRSSMSRSRHRAMARRFSLARVKTERRASRRPDDKFSAGRDRGLQKPDGRRARTAMALGAPVAHRFVPRAGQPAISIAGSPRRAPHPPPRADLLADEKHRASSAPLHRSQSCRRSARGPYNCASSRPRLDGFEPQSPSPWCGRGNAPVTTTPRNSRERSESSPWVPRYASGKVGRRERRQIARDTSTLL